MLNQNVGRGPKKGKVSVFMFNHHPEITLMQVAQDLDPSLLSMPWDPPGRELESCI